MDKQAREVLAGCVGCEILNPAWVRDVDGDLPLRIWITDKTKFSSFHADVHHNPDIENLRLLAMLGREISQKLATEIQIMSYGEKCISE